MANIIKKDLFDKNASLYVLSCLMRKPLLLQEDRYAIRKTDFSVPLHQMVFSAIYNMVQNGVEKVSPQDIDLHLKQYGAQYEYYKKERGYEFVLQCYQTSENSDDKQFDYYYERLKKFSILRELERVGVDTTCFYDTEKDTLNRDLEDDKLNRTSLKQIFEKVRADLIHIENEHMGKEEQTAKNAGYDLQELVDGLRQQPEVGLPLDGDIVNFAARGARAGKLYTYSAPSGAGKTRYMVGNACAISMPYIDDNGQVVMRGDDLDRQNYQKVLFVTTEQQVDEIQTMILAYVSGVNEKNILLGNYSPADYDRLTRAIAIIKAYADNFIIECIPDPSIALIKARLTKYVTIDNVRYIFYDYIFSSPGLLSEFRDVAVREDVALMMLSNTLKEIASEHDIFIQSATQLNDSWSKNKVGLRDQNCLRGSKAIADKIDMGIIGVRLTDEEKEQIQAIWGELQKQDPIKYSTMPNIVMDIYKNRRGELNCVKIFRYFDYGTCRCKDLFITDASYQGIKDIGQLKFAQRKVDFLDLKTGGIIS